MWTPKKGTPEYEAWVNTPEYEAWRQKDSDSHKGKIPHNKGKRLTAEQRATLAAEGKNNIWTPEEDRIVLEKYLTHSARQLTELLPRRTIPSIQLHAKALGLRKASVMEPAQKDIDASNDLFLPSEDEKKCFLCGRIKPLTQFFKYAQSPDGYFPRCRTCYQENRKSYRKTLDSVPDLNDVPEDHRRCSRCLEIKPLDAFGSNKWSKDGKRSHCKACRRQASADRHRETNLLQKYDLTLQEYDELIKTQGGVCACCGKPETALDTKGNGKLRPLSIDHCHISDAIRGLLCYRCNITLGILHENPERVKALLKYVEERCLW